MTLLTPEERDRIHEVEVLRADIRTALKPPETGSGKGWFARFVGHDAGRLVIGFLLTTAVGSWLTYWWKQKELANQGEAATQQARLSAQALLLQDLTMSVSESLVACHDVLSLAFYAERPPGEVEVVRKDYFTASRKWRTDSKVIRVRLAVHFKSSAIHHAFEGMISNRRQLGVAMMRLLTGTISGPDREAVKKDALALANRVEEQLVDCAGLMAAEIESPDEAGRTATSPAGTDLRTMPESVP